MMRSMERWLAHAALATLLLAALTGCSSVSTGMAPTKTDSPASLDSTAWVLAALPDVELVREAPATLRFEAGRALGSDGCNRYSIGYTAQDGRLAFPSPGVGTRMACPPAVMKQADVFLLAVSGATGYRMHNGQLQLLGADGAVRATLDSQSTTLAGTRWRATGINNGRGAVQGVASGSTVTLAFEATGQDGGREVSREPGRHSGRISGSAGCNRFMGNYSGSGGTLQLSPAATTRMACPDERLAEQEDAFIRALASVSTLHMDADRLELRTATGALAATFTRERN